MASTGSMHFSGLISGIDTDSIIESLMSLQRQPQDLLVQKTEDYTAKKSVYSELSSKLSSLQTAINTIKDIADPLFEKCQAVSLQTQIADAVITGYQPTEGSYQVTITQLATAALVNGQEALYTGADATAQAAVNASTAGINASGQTVDPTQSLSSQSAYFALAPDASGTITINGTDLNWDSSMSLNEIIGRINNMGNGVTAGFDAGTQTVTLSSNDTGSTATLEVAESAGNLLEAFNLTAGTSTGSDAVAVNIGATFDSGDAHLDRAVTSGTFTLNGVIFNVDASTDTLQSVLVRINSSSAGVTAAFNSATGEISLTQKEGGSANQIVLGADGDTSNILYALKLTDNNPPTGGAGDTYAGTDALVSVNGGAVKSYSSNTVDTLIPGVTLNLRSEGTATVNVESDVDGMVEAISDFVTAYNDVMEYINTKTAETRLDDPTTAEERIQGTFTTDRNFIDTKSALNTIVGGLVSGLPNTLNQLAQIGIEATSDDYGKSAKLEIDTTKLKAALTSDAEGVAAIFNTSGGGIMAQMTQQIKSLNNIVDGSLTMENKNLDEGIDRLNERIATMEETLTAREAALRLQFANMETMISELKAAGEKITSLLGTE